MRNRHAAIGVDDAVEDSTAFGKPVIFSRFSFLKTKKRATGAWI